MNGFFRKSALILSVFGVLPFAGCSPFTENNTVEEIAPITFLSINEAGGGKIKISTLVPPMVKESKRLLSMETQLLNQGRKNFNLRYDRELKLGQLRLLLVNEDFARNEGLLSVINALLADPDISYRLYLAVVKGNFDVYLQSRMAKQDNLDLDLYRMFHHYEKKNQGELTIVNLHQFLKELYAPYSDPILPVFRASKDDFNYEGTAFFNGDKMVAEAEAFDDQIFQLLDNKHFLKLLPLPSLSLTLGHVRATPNIRIDRGAASLAISVDVKARIEEYRGEKDLQKPGDWDDLVEKTEALLEDRMTNFLHNLQKWRVDPLQLGDRTLHPFARRFGEKEWDDFRDRMKVNVTCKLHIRSQTQPLTGKDK